MLLGSVSQGVVQHSTLPVLIVRPDTEGVRKVLIGYDDSPEARKSLSFLERFRLPLDVELIFSYVDTPLPKVQRGQQAPVDGRRCCGCRAQPRRGRGGAPGRRAAASRARATASRRRCCRASTALRRRSSTPRRASKGRASHRRFAQAGAGAALPHRQHGGEAGAARGCFGAGSAVGQNRRSHGLLPRSKNDGKTWTIHILQGRSRRGC